MVVENIITHLEMLRFSKIEAQVYVTLVKHSKLNGSQIAKILNLSRSSVYSALHNLYNRGIVFLLPGESNVYKAQDPDILLETLKNEYIQAADELKDELSRFKFVEVEKEYWNIRGYQNFLLKTKSLKNLRNAGYEFLCLRWRQKLILKACRSNFIVNIGRMSSVIISV